MIILAHIVVISIFALTVVPVIGIMLDGRGGYWDQFFHGLRELAITALALLFVVGFVYLTHIVFSYHGIN